ncbi:TPA: Spy/CpxP family protein refolding chaperone [Aeromonas hydrophila]
MKTGTRRILIGLTSATLLLGGLTACGTRGPGGWSEERVTEMSGKMVERIGDKLDLNAEQKIKLDAVAAEMQAQRKAFRGDSANPRDDIKALIASDKFDRSKAQALLEQKTAAVQQQGPKVLTALADFYDSLTPAQQQQVRERLDPLPALRDRPLPDAVGRRPHLPGLAAGNFPDAFSGNCEPPFSLRIGRAGVHQG